VLAATLTDTKKTILAGFVIVAVVVIVWSMHGGRVNKGKVAGEATGPRSIHFGPVAPELTEAIAKTRARLKDFNIASTFTSELRGAAKTIRDELVADKSAGAVFVVPPAAQRSGEHDALLFEVGLSVEHRYVLLLSQDVSALPAILRDSNGKYRVREFAQVDELEGIIVATREFLTVGRTA
jgi:hypothetical protein